jgi:hypothetical protein
MTNREEIFDLIGKHPEGLDDDELLEMTGIQPRQQVQQLCNQLANSKRIRRESIEKAGKRRKIHNFPMDAPKRPAIENRPKSGNWRRRLSALVAATGRDEEELLEEALYLLAMRVLREGDNKTRAADSQKPASTT